MLLTSTLQAIEHALQLVCNLYNNFYERFTKQGL